MSLRVFIGFDSREQKAYDVAEKTFRSFGCETFPIYEDRLRALGLLTRPVDRRARMYDLNSDAEQSTQFAISRFLAPILAHTGWCLAVDCDTVCLEDPHELQALADEAKAVHVVKHAPHSVSHVKMDGQTQSYYRRKNWSSVALWNADHQANRRLNLTIINQWPGRDLHAFGWLADSEIGDLPAEANWLVGLQPKPARPIIAHYTMGTPDMPGFEHSEHAELWTEASQR